MFTCAVCLKGKTVDISIYQKHSNGTYIELHKPTEGPWRGTKVDEAFYQMITRIVGASCFRKFINKDEFKADNLDIQRELELKKKKVKPESNSKILFKLPFSLTLTFEEETGEKLN